MNRSKNKVKTPEKVLEKVIKKPEFKPYIAEVAVGETAVYKEASAESAFMTNVRKGWAYTIIAEDKGFGKLKSGVGWVSLNDIKTVVLVVWLGLWLT